MPTHKRMGPVNFKRSWNVFMLLPFLVDVEVEINVGVTQRRLLFCFSVLNSSLSIQATVREWVITGGTARYLFSWFWSRLKLYLEWQTCHPFLKPNPVVLFWNWHLCWLAEQMIHLCFTVNLVSDNF